MTFDLFRKPSLMLLSLSLVLFLTACGGGSSSGDGEGTLSTSLTDASTDEYQAVYVTVARVDVHLGGDPDEEGLWETVAEPGQTYNLLELVNGEREELGVATLDAGHYTQLRLIIGAEAGSGENLLGDSHPFANYLIDQAGNDIELKVPSGPQTGLKIVNGFDINENQTTELILDFDAMRSVVKAGASGQYLLKPTIKVLDSSDNATVSGLVTDTPDETDPATDPAPLAEALISAQTADPAATDAKDRVVIETGTLTDEFGEYTLFLPPADYNLVAVKDGYLPRCAAVSLAADSLSTVDFSLTAAGAVPGTVSFTVALAETSVVDPYATIDFRQQIDCESAGGTEMTWVTVKSVNVAAGDHTVELPAGIYQLVVSSAGMATQTAADVEVVSGGTTAEFEFDLVAN